MTSEDVTLYSLTYRSWRVGSIKTRIETIPESRRQKAEGSWRVGSIKTRIGHFRKEARIILWIGK